MQPHQGILRRYGEFLPLTAETPLLSLGEGDTPLVPSSHLIDELGCASLHFKLEGCNPTGLLQGPRDGAGDGESGRSGLPRRPLRVDGQYLRFGRRLRARAACRRSCLVPASYVALGKLAQAMIYGARVVVVDGNFDEALEVVRALAERHPLTIVNSINPFRLEGQKTAAFEVCDALGDAPDILAIPVGNAGNITAYWRGFKEFHAAGRSTGLPRMYGFEARAPLPSCAGKSCPLRKPSPRPSVLAIPPTGTTPFGPATNRAGSSTASQTRRFSPRTRCWPTARASSVSRPRRLPSPGSADSSRRAISISTGKQSSVS